MDTLTFTPTDNDTLMENDEFAFILKSDGKRLYILVQAVFKHSWTLIIHTLAPSIFFSPIHCFSPTSGLPRKLIFGILPYFTKFERICKKSFKNIYSHQLVLIHTKPYF